MVRVKTNARYEAFLAAAAEVFQEMSFDQATMDEIAARVGSSKATLYRYFDSKEALFMALIQRTANGQGGRMVPMLHAASGGVPPDQNTTNDVVDLMGTLNPTEDVAIALTRFGHHVLKAFHTPKTLAVQRMVIAASVNPEIGRMFYEQGPARAIKFAEQYFAAVIQKGQIRPSDPHVVACHYFGLLESEVHQAGIFNVVTEIDDKEISEIVTRTIEVFMRAYGSSKD
ncbi:MULTISPECIES: TetR/AcrR family transcriptional regulator [Methylotenera]|uniref:TetR/AcrR family transcriptional regulator n=1 Tax=Methylotenera TaxID=359407 RepID=UPI0003664579|nr:MULTISPECIES: TetR/AcrR family transcriptional regulator [Methylotenera]